MSKPIKFAAISISDDNQEISIKFLPSAVEGVDQMSKYREKDPDCRVVLLAIKDHTADILQVADYINYINILYQVYPRIYQ